MPGSMNALNTFCVCYKTILGNTCFHDINNSNANFYVNRFYSRQMKQFFTIYKNMPISKNYPVFSYLFLTWQKYIKQLEYTTLYFQNVLSLGSVTSNILPLTNIVFSKKLMHTYRLGLWWIWSSENIVP